MGKLSAAWTYCQRVWRYRHFWLSLVQLDLQAKYRRSVLGVGWSLLHPLAMSCVLCVVFHEVFGQPIRTFVPFVLTGLAIWNFITSVTLEGCCCLYNGEKYIRSQPIPVAIYPLRTLLSVGIHFLIILGLTAAFSLSVRGFASPVALLALLPGLLLLFVFGWAVAVLFGFANLYFPDTHHIAQIGLQVLFYLTPIFYPAEAVPARWLRFIIEHNPLGVLVALIREPIVHAQPPSLYVFGLAVAMVGTIAATAIYVLSRLERTIVFQL
jgi:ABC-type polysaccharide/polyol phosphate export permease